MIIGKWLCALIRYRGGKHLWREGKCARCGRKQPQRKRVCVEPEQQEEGCDPLPSEDYEREESRYIDRENARDINRRN